MIDLHSYVVFVILQPREELALRLPQSCLLGQLSFRLPYPYPPAPGRPGSCPSAKGFGGAGGARPAIRLLQLLFPPFLQKSQLSIPTPLPGD